MLVLTWELHFAAPGSPELYSMARTDLRAMRAQYTDMRIDWVEEKGRLSVTVQDIEVFVRVMRGIGKVLVLKDISCGFFSGPVSGRVVLGPEGESEDMSGISFPMDRM